MVTFYTVQYNIKTSHWLIQNSTRLQISFKFHHISTKWSGVLKTVHLHKPTYTHTYTTQPNGKQTANWDVSAARSKGAGFKSTLLPNLGVRWRCLLHFNIYFKFFFYMYKHFWGKGNNSKIHSHLLHVLVYICWQPWHILSFFFHWLVSLDWKESCFAIIVSPASSIFMNFATLDSTNSGWKTAVFSICGWGPVEAQGQLCACSSPLCMVRDWRTHRFCICWGPGTKPPDPRYWGTIICLREMTVSVICYLYYFKCLYSSKPLHHSC